jgi:hypothetical protein
MILLEIAASSGQIYEELSPINIQIPKSKNACGILEHSTLYPRSLEFREEHAVRSVTFDNTNPTPDCLRPIRQDMMFLDPKIFLLLYPRLDILFIFEHGMSVNHEN